MGAVILGLETSCDETSAAVVVDGAVVKSNVISSQIDIHKKYGGVVPEIASRKHLEMVNTVIREALDRAEMDFQDLNAVAVTYGPGLVGALLIGVTAAKSIAYTADIPLLGVNHLEGHIFANLLVEPDLELPVVCLIVSGGHTDLVLIKEWGQYELLGATRDDAAGEAFDKVARVLGLGYPGGPAIDEIAPAGDDQSIMLPRSYLAEGSLEFSFSGLKTAVSNYWQRAQRRGESIDTADMAACFRRAVVDVLVHKTMLAARQYGIKTILLAGGVAANRLLRSEMAAQAAKEGLQLISPPLELCTDNAAMIARAAFDKYKRRDFAPLTLNARPSLQLGLDNY